MYKMKAHPQNLAIDMTAMCDVAFLLLVFFVLASKPKGWSPVKINVPFATSQEVCSMRDLDQAEILLGQGKVMYVIPDPAVREQTLAQMNARYHLSFSPGEISKFSKVTVIGTPVSGLKQYIDGYYNERSFFGQAGIPSDSANNELANWIYESRLAFRSVRDKDLGFIISADAKTKYPQIAAVIDVLQSQHINNFTLHTNLKENKNE
jgi:biopolymer transport protein ExbD